MTLVEFLRARLDEDEAKAEQANDSENFRLYVRVLSDDVRHPIYIGAGRALAEVEAKRRIITMYEDALSFIEMMKERGEKAPAHEVAAESYLNVIRAHTAVYSDHPDYRPEWKP